MLITKLQVAGLRSIEQAEFKFQPGMNLLVGINGVGKTTVLDALRICLSRVLPDITASRSSKLSFMDSDITERKKAMQLFCDIELDGKNFTYTFQKQRQVPISNQPDNKTTMRLIIHHVEDVYPPLLSLFPGYNEAKQQPIAVYFSTRRSIVLNRELTIAGRTAVGGQTAAYDKSLSDKRETRLQPIAQWFKAQQALADESLTAQKHIEALQSAVTHFLPDFNNLRVVGREKNITFRVNKNNIPLPIDKLSDGERGVLAIVLDLARRLSQANPGLEDPVKDGVAIVLIDELDLHLHPKWQRTIVENLTRTFQNCQFIATTHSPQIIGEVKPERITIIDKNIYQPASSFGMDSSQVLEEIMDTPSRNEQVEELLSKLTQQIDNEKLPEAKKLLEKLKTILGPQDPEVTRSATLIDFLESEVSE